MFDELEKYKSKGHFFFEATDALAAVCNAPKDKGGIYLIYALHHGRVDLFYIGSAVAGKSGGAGGLQHVITNGNQPGNVPKSISWASQMLIDNIASLDIYWYVTADGNKVNDEPAKVEKKILKVYLDIYGELPVWNTL